jgi:hypothetical protein
MSDAVDGDEEGDTSDDCTIATKSSNSKSKVFERFIGREVVRRNAMLISLMYKDCMLIMYYAV